MDGYFKVFLLLVYTFCVKCYQYTDDIRRLKTDVFSKTDSSVLPMKSSSDKITVNVTIFLFTLLEVDVAAQSMIFQAGFDMKWVDEVHSWDSGLYGNVTQIKTDAIWTPSAIIGNNMMPPYTLENIGYLPSIQQNGHAQYMRGKTAQTACNVDVSKFPIDSQMCRIIIMNPDGDHVQFQIVEVIDYSKFDNGLLETRGEWEIVDSEAIMSDPEKHNSVAGENYMIITINVRRRYLFYILTVIIPCMLIAFGSQCVFLIPINCGEKIAYSISIMLSFSIFFNAINGMVPKTSDPVSHLLVYLILSFTLSVLSTFGTIAVEYCYNTEYKKKTVPRLLWKVVVGKENGLQSPNIDQVKPFGGETSPPESSDVWKHEGSEWPCSNEHSLKHMETEWRKFAYELNCLWFKMTSCMTLINTVYFMIALTV